MYRIFHQLMRQEQHFDEETYSNLQTTHEEYTSKVHINKNFLDESKKIRKKFRINKRNPSLKPDYYKKLPQYKTKNLNLFKNSKTDHVHQTSLPNTMTYTYEGIGSSIYNCRFTNDGKILLVTSRSGTAFFNFADDDTLSVKSVIACNGVAWAITDSDISNDNKFMIHSTMSPVVQMFNVATKKYTQAFNFKSGGSAIDEDEYQNYWGMRIFSVKLSDDTKEMIAGCGRSTSGAPIQVYDIEANKVKHSITAHADDINTICYVDRKNTNTFISGSDDCTCKLWDTRILKNNSPVGIFYGHMSGITSVNSREDNNYFCSNSKDQSLKLWDIRKASTEKKTNFPQYRYDYRYEPLDSQTIAKIKDVMKTFDQSVASFWGHKVHRTLIRAHFSPEYNTGKRYLYTGSFDGKVYIYDTLTGETASVLEVKAQSEYDEPIVRDCIWHPFAQSLITTNFNGEVHRWDYSDLSGAKKIEKPSYTFSSHPFYAASGDNDDEVDQDFEDEEEYDEDYEGIEGDDGEPYEQNEPSEDVSDESEYSDWKPSDN